MIRIPFRARGILASPLASPLAFPRFAHGFSTTPPSPPPTYGTSVGSPSEKSGIEGGRLIRATDRIVSSPIGSLSKGNVNEASACMDYWSRRRCVESGSHNLSLLDRMSREEEVAKIPMITSDMYASAITALALGASPDPSRALSLLEEMVDKYPSTPPNMILISGVINAHAKIGDAETAEAILRTILEVPNTITYVTVMDAWAKLGEVDRVETLFREMESRNVEVNINAFNVLLNAYAKKGDARKADEILRLVISDRTNVEPDLYSFGTVIDAWAECSETDPEAAPHAEMILRKQLEFPLVTPDSRTFNQVMKAWSRHRNARVASDKVEALFHEMTQLSAAGNEIRPDTYTFNTLLTTMARSGQKGPSAEGILKQMEELHREGNADVRPDLTSYNAVIDAYAKTTNGAQHAERLFQTMEKDPTQGEERIKPDGITFNSLVHAYANSGMAQSAEQTLEFMHSLNLPVDIITYNSVIDAHAKTGNAQSAQSLLFLMERQMDKTTIRPDKVTYGTVMNAWARHGRNHPNENPSAGERAQELLERMESQYNKGNHYLKPNIILFNTIINAHAKSKSNHAPVKAAELLTKMITLHSDQQFYSTPDMVSFCSVINAFAFSNSPQKAQEAHNWLQQMTLFFPEKHLQLNQRLVKNSRNMVINAAAFTTSRDPDDLKSAMKIAMDIWELMRTERTENITAGPDDRTYAQLLRCCLNLIYSGKLQNALALKIFVECCEDGMVDAIILRYIWRFSSGREYLKDYPEIPKEWGRNVVRGSHVDRRTANVKRKGAHARNTKAR